MARVSITPEQLDTYQQKGFVILENVFSAEEMAELDGHLTRHAEEHERQLREQGDYGINRAGEIAFTNHIAEHNDAIRQFVCGPAFVDISTAMIGPDVDLYWNQTVYKHPEGEKEFPWHQDDAYTEVEPSPYLTLWLAINDATLENGCIWVLPESHRDGLRPHENSPIGLVGYPSDAPDQGIPVPVSAGSVIAFQSLLLHKSGPNRSQGMRKAYVIQYSAANLRLKATGEVLSDKIPVAREGSAA